LERAPEPEPERGLGPASERVLAQARGQERVSVLEPALALGRASALVSERVSGPALEPVLG